MKPTFRKLEVKDIGTLETLVAENVEGIEAGLRIIDTRLLLGQAVIDLIGLDSKDSLVLIALDFTADEGLLLRVMDAYSWCLEFPETLRRLYPMAKVSAERPPRILFVVQRLTEAFLRRTKQLSALEIDCLEFRHLEVGGASAVYFDLVERLCKAGAPAAAPTAAPVLAERPAPAAVSVKPAAMPVTVEAEPAVLASPAPALAPSVTREPSPTREVAAATESLESRIASLVAESVAEARAASTSSEARPRAASDVPVAMEPVPAAAEAEAEPALALEPIETTTRAAAEATKEFDWESFVEQHAPAAVAEAPSAVPASPEPMITAPAAPEPVPAVAAAPLLTPPPAEPLLAAPAPPPAWAKSSEKVGQPANGGRTYFFAQASRGNAPVTNGTPAAAPTSAPTPATNGTPVAAATPSAPPAPAQAPELPRPELDGLSLPTDGLSRQWLEFLNQLGATTK